MKRFFLLFALLFTMPEIGAQETGIAASTSTEIAQGSSNWQNWVFSGSALATATLGVVIISLNTGTTAH